MWTLIHCWHKWSEFEEETYFTGAIELRLSDGMLMAKRWSDLTRKCLKCGAKQVLTNANSESMAVQKPPKETGTRIDITWLSSNVK